MNDSEILQAILLKLDNTNSRLDSMQKDTNSRLDSMQKDTNSRLDSMQKDISQLKEDVSQIKEDAAITRVATNELLDWADFKSAHQFPIYEKHDVE